MSEAIADARADVRRYLSEPATSVWPALRAIRSNLGLQAVLVYRFGRLLEEQRGRFLRWPLLALGWPLYWLASAFVRAGYGIRIDRSVRLGPGFYVGHFGGIELVNCSFGPSCSIGQQTRVGERAAIDGPRIGSRVWVGAHARVRGAIRVGDEATIAPGAAVAKDVPPRSLLVGDPARIVSRSYDNSRIRPPG